MAWVVAAAGVYVGSKYLQSQNELRAEEAKLTAAEKATEKLETGFSSYEERMDAARGDIKEGYAQARQDYTTATERYTPYAQKGESALDMYMAAFTPGGEANVINTPMFKAQQDEMNKQIAARLAASGKTTALKSIESTFAPAQQQLLQGAYSDYFNRLNPIIGYGYGATGQQAQFDVGKARLAETQGRTLASLNQAQGTMGYQHGANLGSVELGKGVIESDYHKSMGNIYGGIAEDAGRIYGYMKGGK